MKSAYTRRGCVILRYRDVHSVCLTLTGARFKLWRLRRAETDAERTERKMNRVAGL